MDVSNLNERFQHLTYPPDFRRNDEMRDKLEAILMEDEDEDKMKGLEEFLEVSPVYLHHNLGPPRASDSLYILHVQVMVGKAYYHQINKGDDPDFACRATLIKWIYEYDFVNDFASLPTVQAVLEVKERIAEKQKGDEPPNRYLY